MRIETRRLGLYGSFVESKYEFKLAIKISYVKVGESTNCYHDASAR